MIGKYEDQEAEDVGGRVGGDKGSHEEALGGLPESQESCGVAHRPLGRFAPGDWQLHLSGLPEGCYLREGTYRRCTASMGLTATPPGHWSRPPMGAFTE
jgi:hypothetical protein